MSYLLEVTHMVGSLVEPISILFRIFEHLSHLTSALPLSSPLTLPYLPSHPYLPSPSPARKEQVSQGHQPDTEQRDTVRPGTNPHTKAG